MRGKAVQRDPVSGAVVSSMASLEVLRHWRLVSCATELAVRRLKWYQSAVAEPDSHALMLASIFGLTKGEAAAGILPGFVGNTICEDHASPWALQFSKDLDRLALFDDGLRFLEDFGEAKLAIFTVPEAAEQFLALDMTQLRACELSVAFAPPGLEYLASLDDEDEDPHDAGLFTCAMCALNFVSRQSLLLHIRKNTTSISAPSWPQLQTSACVVRQSLLPGSRLVGTSSCL